MSETTKSGSDIINSILGKIEQDQQNLISLSKTILDGKEHITFAVESRKVQPEPPLAPVKAESPRRSHSFDDAESLAEYLSKYKTKNTVVFIDIANERVSCVIDELSSNGFEIIQFKPIQHPLFVPWAELLNSEEPTELKNFTDFLTRNRRSIVSLDSKSLLLMLSQVKVSKKIQIQRGFGKHSVNGVTCEMDIAGQSKNQDIEIPDSIKISVPLYLSTQSVELEIDLTLDSVESEIVVSCTSADLLQKRVEAFEAMASIVQSIDDIVVGLGAPSHYDWKYLPVR